MTVPQPPATFRTLLRAYPRSFRDDFGPDMAQLFADRRRHGDLSKNRLVAREALDCLRTAPRLHLENPMTRNTFLVVLVAAAVLGFTLAGGPGLIPALVLTVFLLGFRREHPIAGLRASRWWTWFVAAAGAAALLFIVLAVDGDNLTPLGWTLAFLSGNGAMVLVLIGIGLGVAQIVQNSRSAPTP